MSLFNPKFGLDNIPVFLVRAGRSAMLSRAADFALVAAVSTAVAKESNISKKLEKIDNGLPRGCAVIERSIKMIVNNSELVQEVDVATLRSWFDAQRVILVDVREPGEYAGERIFGAKLVPLSRFNPEEIRLLEEKQSDKQVVLYCQSGNRSGKAARQLLDAGFTSATHLQGGILAWKQVGYPTAINKNAPISIMRQVQIVAGTVAFTGTILGAFVSPWFLVISGLVGAGLIFSGVSGTCALGLLLAKLPYNQRV